MSMNMLKAKKFMPIILGVTLLFSGMFSELYSQTDTRLSLENCIKTALRENSGYKIARMLEDMAKTSKALSVQAYLPSVSAAVSSSQTRVGPSLNNRVVYQGIELTEGAALESPGFVTNSHFIGATISQLIFDGGTSINRIRQGSARTASAEAVRKQARSQVILECKRRFYSLKRAVEFKKTAQKSFNAAQKQLNNTELLFKGKAVSRLDVSRARVAENTAKMLLLQADSDIIDSKASLNTFLGRPHDAIIDLIEPETAISLTIINSEEVLIEAQENSNNIKSLEQQVKAGQYSVAASKGGFFPSIRFTGSYYRYNSEFSKVYNNIDKNYSIYYGISVNYNLFDGFRRKSRIESENLQLSIAEENLASAKKELIFRINSEIRRHNMLVEIYKLQTAGINEAEKAVKLANEQYRNGHGTLLDVITAEKNFISKKYQHIKTLFDAVLSEAEIFALTGGDDY